MLNVIVLNVVGLNVVALNVVAPKKTALENSNLALAGNAADLQQRLWQHCWPWFCHFFRPAHSPGTSRSCTASSSSAVALPKKKSCNMGPIL
jgi:hypothetical protein